MIKLIVDELPTDPDIEIGGYLTMQRQDGRSLWQQRFIVTDKGRSTYCLKPVDVMHGYT